jgi:hypothetical protein
LIATCRELEAQNRVTELIQLTLKKN